MDEERKDTN